jgi:hypothetical protein
MTRSLPDERLVQIAIEFFSWVLLHGLRGEIVDMAEFEGRLEAAKEAGVDAAVMGEAAERVNAELDYGVFGPQVPDHPVIPTPELQARLRAATHKFVYGSYGYVPQALRPTPDRGGRGRRPRARRRARSASRDGPRRSDADDRPLGFVSAGIRRLVLEAAYTAAVANHDLVDRTAKTFSLPAEFGLSLLQRLQLDLIDVVRHAHEADERTALAFRSFLIALAAREAEKNR